MPIKTFVAGETLTASDVNAYLGKQAVIVVTSGTRPSAPNQGMTIYETDTSRLLTWDGATWNLPKNVAGGQLGYAEVLTTQTTITTTVDLTGLSVSVTVGASRRIRISADVRLQSSVDNDYGVVQILEGATVIQVAQMKLGTSTQNISPVVRRTPAAGTYTYKLQAGRSVGTGTLATNHSANNPALLVVEDLGGV